jgi:hypothetical protein
MTVIIIIVIIMIVIIKLMRVIIMMMIMYFHPTFPTHAHSTHHILVVVFVFAPFEVEVHASLLPLKSPQDVLCVSQTPSAQKQSEKYYNKK